MSVGIKPLLETYSLILVLLEKYAEVESLHA